MLLSMSAAPRCPPPKNGRNPELTDDQRIDVTMEHTILLNRPIVIGVKGVMLCRPSKEVLSVLGQPLTQRFIREDGEVVPAYG
jgi:arsenate reductase